MREVSELIAASQQKLSDELRWVDEEHMRCRSEDESKVSTTLGGLRAEVFEVITELRGQVEEAIVPPGEPGALSTLRQALARIDVLGEAVGQLCEYMNSLKIKEVAAAAETRIGEIERKLGSGIAGGVASAQLEERLATLEDALVQEQQSSLKALQAILEHSQPAK